jgi:hypothetical protein
VGHLTHSFCVVFFIPTSFGISQKQYSCQTKRGRVPRGWRAITGLQKKEIMEDEDKREKRAERGKMSHPARHYPISQDLFSQLSGKAMHDEFVKSLFHHGDHRDHREYF